MYIYMYCDWFQIINKKFVQSKRKIRIIENLIHFFIVTQSQYIKNCFNLFKIINIWKFFGLNRLLKKKIL